MTDFVEREKRFRRINQGLLAGYAAIALITIFWAWRRGDSYGMLQVAGALAMLAVPPVVQRLTRVTITADCRLVFYAFTFCAMIMGSGWGFYSSVWAWDKLLHFASGIVITTGGLVVYHLLSHTRQPLDAANGTVALAFAYGFNALVASLWEVYEYFLDLFAGVDAQNVAATGVGDTMQDIIVCLLGGLVALWLSRRQIKTGRSFFLMDTYLQMLRGNGYLDRQPGGDPSVKDKEAER